eukprot:INCI11347.3.p1 GENE.INCI11347.3~~INCI11347.3.p1  ORF type:complete len:645 (+),score=92.97 INCI11347.3:43-1977(+)
MDARIRLALRRTPFLTQSGTKSRETLARAVVEMFQLLRDEGRIRVVHSDAEMARGLMSDPSQVNHTFDQLSLPKLVVRLQTLWLRRIGPGPRLEQKMKQWAAGMSAEQRERVRISRSNRNQDEAASPEESAQRHTQEEHEDEAQRLAALHEVQFELALGQILQSRARAFTTHTSCPRVFIRSLGHVHSRVVTAPGAGAVQPPLGSESIDLSHDLVHEICHILCGDNGGCHHALFRCSMALDEGVTEYFAQEVCAYLGIAAPRPLLAAVAVAVPLESKSYDRATSFIRWLCHGNSVNESICGGGFDGMEQVWFSMKFGRSETEQPKLASETDMSDVVAILSKELERRFLTARAAATRLYSFLSNQQCNFTTKKLGITSAAELKMCAAFIEACGPADALPWSSSTRAEILSFGAPALRPSSDDTPQPALATMVSIVLRAYSGVLELAQTFVAGESDGDGAIEAKANPLINQPSSVNSSTPRGGQPKKSRIHQRQDFHQRNNGRSGRDSFKEASRQLKASLLHLRRDQAMQRRRNMPAGRTTQHHRAQESASPLARMLERQCAAQKQQAEGNSDAAGPLLHLHRLAACKLADIDFDCRARSWLRLLARQAGIWLEEECMLPESAPAPPPRVRRSHLPTSAAEFARAP